MNLRKLLSVEPTIAIITNLELEHVDCYRNLEDWQDNFTRFCKSVPFYGEVIACIIALRKLYQKLRAHDNLWTVKDAAYRLKNLQFKAEKSTYSVFRSEECLGDIELMFPVSIMY